MRCKELIMQYNFSPIAFSILGLDVHWYSLAYIFGLLIALKITNKLAVKFRKNFSKELIEDFISYAIVGIIVGGRIGHILFYDFQYYASNPVDIIKIWKGGMSFYGGFLGVICCSYIFCKTRKIDFFGFMDLWSISVPIGLLLGRIANFINDELPGKVTNVPWAIRSGISVVARHPSQIYEAILEGILLFFVMVIAVKFKAYEIRSRLSGIFCTGYGMARFIAEFFREPDSPFSWTLLLNTGLNLNQYLSIIMMALGVSILYVGTKNTKSTTAD